jgi:hypothetical protein
MHWMAVARNDESESRSRAYCGTHVGTKKPSTVLNRDCSTADIFVPVYFVLHNPSGDSRSKLRVIGLSDETSEYQLWWLSDRATESALSLRVFARNRIG